jgi:hypothetical protein
MYNKTIYLPAEYRRVVTVKKWLKALKKVSFIGLMAGAFFGTLTMISWFL